MQDTQEYHNDTEEQILFRNTLAVFEKSMQQLPARCRQVYELKELCGLNAREIAAVTGITNSTVKTHLKRAANKIRAFVVAQNN